MWSFKSFRNKRRTKREMVYFTILSLRFFGPSIRHFLLQVKSKVDNILTKTKSIRINLNFDDVPIVSWNYFFHSSGRDGCPTLCRWEGILKEKDTHQVSLIIVSPMNVHFWPKDTYYCFTRERASLTEGIFPDGNRNTFMSVVTSTSDHLHCHLVLLFL